MLKANEIRILVIDDEPLTMKAVATNFEVFGFQVEKADSVEAGRKILEQIDVNIVLLDWHMPKEGGDTFLKEVRAADRTQPAIFLMTGDLSVNAEYIFNEGADGFLLKPFDAAATRDMVQQTCVGPKMMWMTPYRKKAVGEFSAQISNMSDVSQTAMFGRGGIFFEVSSTEVSLEDSVAFNVDFSSKDVSQKIEGFGVVRWVREADQEHRAGVGVEIKFVEDGGRQFLMDWLDQEKPKAFIPKGY